MVKNCTCCQQEFEVFADDLLFYEKIAPVFSGTKYPIPSPTLCPDCRQQRRMAFRNERNLYRRRCDLCTEEFLAIYDAGVPFPVFCYECWWSDKWDAKSYGREFDFSRPFFEQFHELSNQVPHLGIVSAYCENCEYTNYVNYSKNSYLVFGCHAVEDSLYDWRVHFSKDCIDCLQLDKGTECYECVDCDECHQLLFSQDCSSCSDSAFLFDCKNCRDCWLCAGLRNQQYCILNRPYSREEYFQKKREFKLTFASIERFQDEFREFLLRIPRRHVFVLQSENIIGDHIINSRNLRFCFHVKNGEDGAYLESCENIRDALDCTFSGWPGELAYECISAATNSGYKNLFCSTSWNCQDILYCDSCHHSKDLFGCTSLRKQDQFCVLNRQYSKQEYETLIPKIIDHMMETGEWGEFFPVYISPCAYNETIASEFFPLPKDKVFERHWKWKEKEEADFSTVTRKIPAEKLPDNIEDIPDEILDWAIKCSESGRLFRIQRAELNFYRKMKLPVPHLHPDIRHQRRMKSRNPRKLWKRNCMNCEKDIQTTYSPDRPEIVYCEECYLKTVY